MTLITRQEPEFYVQAHLDQVSRRIWVNQYQTTNPTALRNFLKELAREQALEKIIFPVRTEDLNRFSGEGFAEEGVIEGYFPGTNGHFLSAYPSSKRGNSQVLSQEQQILQDIFAHSKRDLSPLPKEFTLRRATRKDTYAMAKLFSEVFKSYPTPVYDPLYLARSMKKGDLFMVVYNRQKLAGVAAAEIDWEHRRAELTNCATHPDYRGLGLNSILLKKVETKCLAQQINCLYSLARATSYGMNLVLHRLGYVYQGTLINNCHIGGGFEDMNIWVRSTLQDNTLSG